MISPIEAWTKLRTGLPVLDAQSLEAWQMARLRDVLAYARCHSRFYGERLRDCEPGAFTAKADLARLPFTWPLDIAQDPLAFLCVPQRDVARVTTLTTSGTSGLPKRIFFTQADISRTVDFFEQGMKIESGTNAGSYFYTRDVRESVQRMQQLIEPVLTVVMGILLGWIMLSVLGPIYDVISKIRI